MDIYQAFTGRCSDTATEVFLIAWRASPGEEEAKVLRRLLQSGGAFESAGGGALLLPRFGTISPWSSKAGGIVARCGLTSLRRVERGWFYEDEAAAHAACDRMTQQILPGGEINGWRMLFCDVKSEADAPVPFIAEGAAALRRENARLGLALSEEEIEHLSALYKKLRRDPTLAELMMFAQANSEHCRHKIFNARWQGEDGESLMSMIRRTHAANPRGVITAFSDNAAVIKSAGGRDFAPGEDGVYRAGEEDLYLVAKAETHNHPTAISPYAGAATGSGGEIRDESAAGRGAAPVAGFCGYMVSRLSDFETPLLSPPADAPLLSPPADAPLLPPPPSHIASPAAIMRDAPLGAAAYNNEFGRPALAGFFRAYDALIERRRYGFHKPVMLAGGVGHMLPFAAGKRAIAAGAKIVQLGGPSFRIGIGGGAASSRAGGGDDALDFASVQRDNAEMQRRAQGVLDDLRRRRDNPVLSLHDVGAGGLANAVCEMVHAAGMGARLSLAAIPAGERGMSAAELWCNESQERYVLAIAADALPLLEEICRREACPLAVLGEATENADIVLEDKDGAAVDLPLAMVLGDFTPPPRRALPPPPPAEDGAAVLCMTLKEAAVAVLRHPSVACKRFLITIGDRTVGGLTARDQMVGPWQTPVADCAVFCDDFTGVTGAAFALGERAPVAALNPAAASRLAIAEALLNLAAADCDWRDVKLSLNWMADCGGEKRDGELRAAVAAAADFCIEIGIGVIVGKDSLSMRMHVADNTPVSSPAFAAAFAFAPVKNARNTLTPQLSGRDDSVLLYADFSGGARRLGASAAAQVGAFSPPPRQTPDISAAALLRGWRALSACRAAGLLLSYHDCSDGGLWAALCEMAFAANCGLDIFTDGIAGAPPETDGLNTDGGEVKAAAALFAEEAAAVFEVAAADSARVMQIFADAGCAAPQMVARPQYRDKTLRVYGGGGVLLREKLCDLRRTWEEVGCGIAAARDNAACVALERGRDMDGDGGLFARLPEAMPPLDGAPLECGAPLGGARPRLAVLRDQGTNGHREMAAAFDRAGFDAVDVTMTDLLDGRATLADFCGAAFCGGFSFGDVLGAGRGWAMSVLCNARLRDEFAAFFARADAFSLGVCNGCQVLARLRPLMPDAAAWRFPDFCENESRRFEARLIMAEVLPSPSPLFAGMHGLMYPLVVSSGEGRAVFSSEGGGAHASMAMRYVDNAGAPAMSYPQNPNGSADAAAGFCSPDGRVTILMPHPERAFRAAQMSWLPPQTRGELTPWFNVFVNARRFIG